MSWSDEPMYDYDNQAWTEIRNGQRVYVRCGHPEEMECWCYGRIHAGEPVDIDKHTKIVVDPKLPPRK